MVSHCDPLLIPDSTFAASASFEGKLFEPILSAVGKGKKRKATPAKRGTFPSRAPCKESSLPQTSELHGEACCYDSRAAFVYQKCLSSSCSTRNLNPPQTPTWVNTKRALHEARAKAVSRTSGSTKLFLTKPQQGGATGVLDTYESPVCLEYARFRQDVSIIALCSFEEARHCLRDQALSLAPVTSQATFRATLEG